MEFNYSDWKMAGTYIGLGMAVSLFVFSLLFILASVLTIEPVNMPEAVPVEIVAGLGGLALVVVLVLLYVLSQSRTPSSRDVSNDSERDDHVEEMDGLASTGGPTGGQQGGAAGQGESGSTAKRMDVNNDTATPSTIESEQSQSGPVQATSPEEARKEGEQREQHDRSPQSRNSSQPERESESAIHSESQDESRETPPKYLREKGGLNTNQNSQD